MTECAPIANQVQLPALFKLMADRIPGVVWATDTDLRFTASFGAGLSALGLHPSEAVGKTLFEYFQTDDEAFPPIAAHARALQGEAVDFEQIWQDRIFRCHLEQLSDDNGSIIGCVGFAQDITEQKQAEAALRASEAKYRRLHQSMMDAFVSVNMDGRIQEFNDAYRQMLGYEPEELHARTYIDITPERWHASQAKIIQEQVLQRGYSDTYEKEYRRKNGTIFPVELRTYLITDENGKPAAMWAIMRDITKRKRAERELQEANERLEERVRERTAELRQANELLQAEVEERRRAEQALRESEQWMQMVLDVSRSFAFEWNVATDRVLRSDSCSRVLGLSGEEALHDTGQRFFQRIHVGDRERFLRILGELKPSAHTYRTEYRVTRGDGTTVVLEESARGFFDSLACSAAWWESPRILQIAGWRKRHSGRAKPSTGPCGILAGRSRHVRPGRQDCVRLPQTAEQHGYRRPMN